MEPADAALAPLLAALAARGLATPAELQAALAVSQPTLSRRLAQAGGRVLALGRGRATRYALPQPILGHAARQPLWWIDEAGAPQPLGEISLLQGGWLHLQGPGLDLLTRERLPWLLAPLAPQGFLGRLLAKRLAAAGLDGNPERWSLAQTLFAALAVPDAPGAIVLGEPAASALPRLPAQAEGEALDALAQDVAATLPMGSSAGGEQPKFLATAADGAPLLVKFSPPRGTPFGERWHELLHAEALALQVLAAQGVPVAAARIVEAPRRTYLLSTRFDRVGAHGRRHVLPIGALHEAFVGGPYTHWAATAQALERQRRLPAGTAAQVQALLHFGRLIGNSDMHAGNLSLVLARDDLGAGRFSLAPVYDMLPMRWCPDVTLGGAPDYGPFEPDPAAAAGPARAVAARYWQALAERPAASRGLHRTAAEMARRLAE
ncbi:MAG: HipA domain-containing protein [Rubrivivax sp.]